MRVAVLEKFGFGHGESSWMYMYILAREALNVKPSIKLILRNGATATFTAYVNKFNSRRAVDQSIRRSAEMRISGSITTA